MTNTPTLSLTAHMTTEFHAGPAGLPAQFEFRAQLPTVLDALRLRDRFPKSCGVRAGTLHLSAGPVDDRIRGSLWAGAKLAGDGSNHGRNEAGIRRYRSIVRAAAKLGIEIAYEPWGRNAYPTREAFEAALEAGQ